MQLRQPRTGYRAAIDPVFLAAAVPDAATSLIDLGCGGGAASLCALARLSGLRATGIEIDAAACERARQNLSLNKFTERAIIIEGDLRLVKANNASAMPGGIAPADCVIANPPFLDAGRADASPDPDRARSNVETAGGLKDWIDAALRLTRPGGWMIMIHRADRLDEILTGIDGRAGGIVVFPLWPKVGMDAKRVLVGARPGTKSPLRLSPGLTLHESDGRYGAQAAAILKGGALTLWR